MTVNQRQLSKLSKLLHGNTLIVPVYWEQVEPEEGKFDFTAVNNLIVQRTPV